MSYLSTVLFLLVGLINFVPVVAVGSVSRLEAMYGVTVSSPDLAILLRHRAMLFGIVGLLIMAAALRPQWRWPALAAGFVSMASFLLLAAQVGGYNALIRRIAIVDVVALVLLALAAAIELAFAPPSLLGA